MLRLSPRKEAQDLLLVLLVGYVRPNDTRARVTIKYSFFHACNLRAFPFFCAQNAFCVLFVPVLRIKVLGVQISKSLAMRSTTLSPRKIPRRGTCTAKRVPIVKWSKGRVPKLLADEIDFDISENDFYSGDAKRDKEGDSCKELPEAEVKAALETCLQLPIIISEPRTIKSPPTISIPESPKVIEKHRTWKSKVDAIAENLLTSQKLVAPQPFHDSPRALLPPPNLEIPGWSFPADFCRQVKFRGGSLLHFWLATQESSGKYKDFHCQIGHTLKEIVDDLLGEIFRRRLYSASNPEIIVFDYSLRIVFNNTSAVYVPEILYIIVPHVFCVGEADKIFKTAVTNFYRHYNTEHALPSLGIQSNIHWSAGTVGPPGPVIDSLVAIPFSLTRLLRFAHPNYPQDFGCMKIGKLAEFVVQYLLAPCRRHLSDGNNRLFFLGSDPISHILKVDVLHISQVPKILETVCPPRIFNKYT